MFEETADKDQKRDGGVKGKSKQAVNASEETKDFYRSQTEVDNAFNKRFTALKEKWEAEQKEKQKSKQSEQRILNLIEKIENQGQDFKKQFPDVDLFSVIEENPLFAYLIMSGKNLIDSYAFLYADDIRQRIRSELEQEIIGNMKSRNNRPRAMNAANSSGSFKDIARLSDAEILKIDQRIKNGERVTF